MANSRIPGLPDGAVITDFYFIMDKAGETSAVKVPYSAVGDLITALQNSTQTNAGKIQTNEDDILALQNTVNILDYEIDWVDMNIVYGSFSGIPKMRCCKVGKIIYITGYFRYSTIPSEDVVIFELPSVLNFPTFTEDFYISAGDGNEDVIYEMKAKAGTRQLVAGAGNSNSGTCYFNAAIPVI